ncbi:hypothetical protein PV05_03471 [Exophiala xenobiotica]|uniref:Uncharacterized protein n=1 Tax=Exophiala xenobiotica TaxID=348802 RepID=A0A0D2ETF8_9EURO|nr:uncharacterized protein PV05_03471 [Exophiala xenobiotica]KIW58983.1 hypothetical protein PV05_03471 [Exophiala xenobiotica]
MEDPERSEVSLAIDYVDADAGMVDADADADPTPETGPTAVSSIPDLSAIDRGQLRRLPESEVRLIEQHGQLYSDIFRKLQLKPGKYFDFWNGVLRVLRSNHLDEIQRGTASVYKQFSNRLLRGYGTIVWVSQVDEWLIDAADLDEGEDRLTYRKPRATRPASDVSENDRFFTILQPLWVRMRNVLFTPRTQSTPRGRRRVGRPRNLSTVKDDEAEYQDLSDSQTPSSPPASSLDRARARSQQKITNLQARMAEVTPTDQKMTYAETERGLVDLIVALSKLRARSDPHIFESLWQEKIMRIDEVEDEVPEEDSTVTDNAVVAQGMIPINEPTTTSTSMSNEPFNSRGIPIKDPNSIIPPTLPSVMSIWISTAYMPSITLSDDGLPNHVHVFAPEAKAYHWVDAPVENLDMSRFIEGVNYRVTTPASKVLGYVLSYGWNDICRFISTGRFEAHEQTKHLGCSEHVQDQGKGKEKAAVDEGSKAKLKGPDVDFPAHQWRVIGVGWPDFQEDLLCAARLGVKVWRMKVCVVTLP